MATFLELFRVVQWFETKIFCRSLFFAMLSYLTEINYSEISPSRCNIFCSTQKCFKKQGWFESKTLT